MRLLQEPRNFWSRHSLSADKCSVSCSLKMLSIVWSSRIVWACRNGVLSYVVLLPVGSQAAQSEGPPPCRRGSGRRNE